MTEQPIYLTRKDVQALGYGLAIGFTIAAPYPELEVIVLGALGLTAVGRKARRLSALDEVRESPGVFGAAAVLGATVGAAIAFATGAEPVGISIAEVLSWL